MTTFQSTALLITFIWAILVIILLRHSGIVLVGGLVVVGVYTLLSFLNGRVTAHEPGLGMPASWLSTFGYAMAGLLVMLACSPLADRLATRFFEAPRLSMLLAQSRNQGANSLPA